MLEGCLLEHDDGAIGNRCNVGVCQQQAGVVVKAATSRDNRNVENNTKYVNVERILADHCR
jgi:hypothetical protein